MTAAGQTTRADGSAGILKLAILAVGGQGGGVLANWVADLAERGGHAAQVTSVAGVAQRTGATIYYIEMAVKSDPLPVFALSPTPGDIDILIASELMEAGRAVMRGFVTPDRTTLIASSHRILAVSEKQVPGDGRKDSAAVFAGLEHHARELICFDMERLAAESGSMISASLFGALARSGALPFAPALFEAVIRESGKGGEASLRAFRATLAHVEPGAPSPPPAADARPVGPARLLKQWQDLERQVAALPAPVQQMARAGLRKCVDYQDPAYGAEYLDHLRSVLRADCPSESYALSTAAAKHIANAMCYDDIIRVADLKTRASRDQRLRHEQAIDGDQVVRVTEYFHPRTEELISILPARLGRLAGSNRALRGLVRALAGNGRRIRSDRLGGFLVLFLAASLRPIRRRLLRHEAEAQHLKTLIETALSCAETDYALGVELFNCQRLIKGYSDTHARGMSKFAKVINALDLLKGRRDAADWLRRLHQAALLDEDGAALDGALATIRSFATNHPATGAERQREAS